MGKLDILRKLARSGALAGTAGAATLMTQDEVKAAGIGTIMRRFGKTAEEARDIKKMAKSVSSDVFEENMKAIQKVTKFKKDPKTYEKIGAGLESDVFEVDGDVLKVPRREMPEAGEVPTSMSPGMVEAVGLGPRTKMINLENRTFQIQPKLKTFERSPWRQTEEWKELERLDDELYKEQTAIANSRRGGWGDFPEEINKRADEIKRKKQELIDRSIEQRQNDPDIQNIAKQYEDEFGRSKNIEQIIENPGRYAANIADAQAERKLSGITTPLDIHEGNIAFTPEGDIKIIDTGFFKDPQPENIPESMKKTIQESFIASPEKRKVLKEILEENRDFSSYETFQDLAKKVAGAGGAAALVGGASEEAEAGIIPRKQAARLLQLSKTDEGLDVEKLKSLLGLEPTPNKFDKNMEKVKDVLGHEMLEKTGRSEEQIMEAVQDMHPELGLADMTTIVPDEIMQKEFPGAFGLARTPTIKNKFFGTIGVDPESTKILLKESQTKDPTQGVSLLGHEAQHAKETRVHPKGVSIPYEPKNTGRIAEFIKNNPALQEQILQNLNNRAKAMGKPPMGKVKWENLQPSEAEQIMRIQGNWELYADVYNNMPGQNMIENVTRGHHIDYPSYELDKLKEISDKGIIVPTPEEVQQINKQSKDLSADFKIKADDIERIKKAAAIAPIATQDQEEESTLDRILSTGKEYAGKGVQAVGEYYNTLDPDTRENIEAGLEHISRPSGALRSAIRAAQNDPTDVSLTEPSGIGEGLLEGWMDPYNAPTGADIADAMNIPDEYVGTKTAVSTAADFADPIDFLGIGGTMKAKKLLGR